VLARSPGRKTQKKRKKRQKKDKKTGPYLGGDVQGREGVDECAYPESSLAGSIGHRTDIGQDGGEVAREALPTA
jgi:hypothetical protein